jgi:6-pyruvoyltetrahydropterin/6-carboxytetrahydropterin synthase
MIRLTRQYRFPASHRLHTPVLSLERNRELFGKCNNPFGHGHDYVLQVTARGPVNADTGLALDVPTLDALVGETVLADLAMADLNRLGDFAARVPTTENLAEAVRARLQRGWSRAFSGPWPLLESVRIQETRRNTFEVKSGLAGHEKEG